MTGYIPSTAEKRREMLKAIGVSDTRELFESVPQSILLKEKPVIPKGRSEFEVSAELEAVAAKNTRFKSIFRGAGAYNHYIPKVVGSVVSKEEFVTAYTPYQAEISQGVLQSIFEYQTMICALTGLSTANASVYDGASAAAEAVAMCAEGQRHTVIISGAANPQVIETVKTYCLGSGNRLEALPCADGKSDFSGAGDGSTACFYVQQPNFYGVIEDIEAASARARAIGAKLIVGCNPVFLAIGKTPGECGADIAVGEAQPLGLPLSFGGPYVGFMTATEKLVRKLPGRIVGRTTDDRGNTAYVLTLQAREQHIRREKASSNICSNQALCALTVSVYLSAMGADGLKEVAAHCLSKAAYAKAGITAIKGFESVFPHATFHEFVTKTPMDSGRLCEILARRGILGGLPLTPDSILWCVTEMNTKAQIDELISVLKEVA
jgi:glycine dehydrogenase subunit 1